MTKYYSKTTGGFYDSDIHKPEMLPEDAKEITIEEYEALLQGQSEGKQIVAATNGSPKLLIITVSLSDVKESRKSFINQERDRILTEGMLFDSSMFDCDSKAQNNLTSLVAAVAAGVPLPDEFTWRSFDNQDIPMDNIKLIQFAGTMLAYTNSVYSKSFKLKNLIDTKSTKTAVNNIDWNTSV